MAGMRGRFCRSSKNGHRSPVTISCRSYRKASGFRSMRRAGLLITARDNISLRNTVRLFVARFRLRFGGIKSILARPTCALGLAKPLAVGSLRVGSNLFPANP